MKAIIVLAGPDSSCDATKKIWQNICKKNNIDFETYEANNESGKHILIKYNVKSFPALIINEKVVAVGHPDKNSAEKLFQNILNSTA